MEHKFLLPEAEGFIQLIIAAGSFSLCLEQHALSIHTQLLALIGRRQRTFQHRERLRVIGSELNEGLSS